MTSIALSPSAAQAYVCHGRWQADCPRPFCGNALELQAKQAQFYCHPPGGCQQIATVEWPSEVDEIDRILAARPVPTTRNWAPAGHRQAICVGFPDGQSVADLIEENAEYMKRVS